VLSVAGHICPGLIDHSDKEAPLPPALTMPRRRAGVAAAFAIGSLLAASGGAVAASPPPPKFLRHQHVLAKRVHHAQVTNDDLAVSPPPPSQPTRAERRYEVHHPPVRQDSRPEGGRGYSARLSGRGADGSDHLDAGRPSAGHHADQPRRRADRDHGDAADPLPGQRSNHVRERDRDPEDHPGRDSPAAIR